MKYDAAISGMMRSFRRACFTTGAPSPLLSPAWAEMRIKSRLAINALHPKRKMKLPWQCEQAAENDFQSAQLPYRV
jgi:hypothetical protein